MTAHRDIMRMVIQQQRLDNLDRLETLWEMICEENDSQIHLVSDSDRNRWISLRDSVNQRLSCAETIDDKINALNPVMQMVEHGYTEDQYRGMDADVYRNVAHVDVTTLKAQS